MLKFLRKNFLFQLGYSGKDTSFLYSVKKEGEEGERLREKGGQSNFVLRVEMMTRRKKQTQKQMTGYTFRKVTAEEQLGPRCVK